MGNLNDEIEKIVRKETLSAYSDLNSYQVRKRNLYFRASHPVKPDDATAIMYDALFLASDVSGYNNFHPGVLLKLDTPMILAREHSVCVYVEQIYLSARVDFFGIDALRKTLDADEFDAYGLFYRIWWG